MTEITVEELKDGFVEALIIDVREKDEFNEGHIRGAVNIPLGAFLRDLSIDGEKMVPKNRTVVIHCASGGRGAIATRAAEKKGWTNVKNLDGGYNSWSEKGFPIQKVQQSKKGRGTDS